LCAGRCAQAGRTEAITAAVASEGASCWLFGGLCCYADVWAGGNRRRIRFPMQARVWPIPPGGGGAGPHPPVTGGSPGVRALRPFQSHFWRLCDVILGNTPPNWELSLAVCPQLGIFLVNENRWLVWMELLVGATGLDCQMRLISRGGRRDHRWDLQTREGRQVRTSVSEAYVVLLRTPMVGALVDGTCSTTAVVEAGGLRPGGYRARMAMARKMAGEPSHGGA
jgi:hypothetical protein